MYGWCSILLLKTKQPNFKKHWKSFGKCEKLLLKIILLQWSLTPLKNKQEIRDDLDQWVVPYVQLVHQKNQPAAERSSEEDQSFMWSWSFSSSAKTLTSHIWSWKIRLSFSISSAISPPLNSVRIMPCCLACSRFSFSIFALQQVMARCYNVYEE